VTDDQAATTAIGANEWLVDEMFERFRSDPDSVGESWREFFADYRPSSGPVGPDAVDGEGAATSAPSPAPGPERPPEPIGDPIRGAAARIVANMDASLTVPTATSYRDVPARLLEVNRRVINGYLGRTRGGKVSFTHLIGYAVVRAIADAMPVMNSGFASGDDGDPPRVVHHERLGLGLAVDVEKRGGRTLLVPCIADADTLDFAQFHAAYQELIRKVQKNTLTPDDFAGTTVTLTNPGTIGTVQSVPRLMSGQGLIVGVGALDYPAAFQAADRRVLADLGMSKVMTISSTYDHRIIQGAESGLFLKTVHDLLLGDHDFYDEVFRSLGVPYEAVRWRTDDRPLDRERAMVDKQMQVNTVINMYRVRGHLIADLDPLASDEPQTHPELDPATYGLTIWDLDRQFLTGNLGGASALMPLGDILHILRDAYCRTIGIEYMHIQEPEEKAWIQEQVEGVAFTPSPEEQRHLLEKLNAAEALEQFLGRRYIGQKRFGIDGAESAIPLIDGILAAAADTPLDGAVIGMAHRGRLNVLVNIVGKSYDQIFEEFEGSVDPETIQGSGDVKYHLGQHGEFRSPAGNTLPVELAANPSHLEAVDPVVEGMVRAKQDVIDPPGSYPVLPLLIHGDAAFAGQGIVAETLNCSQIPGYRVGGTIHLVINNQLGFTTPPEAARSSEYSTDVAKMVQAPILHVNGDDPEACLRVARLAFDYRRRFAKDVVIDMICYRRHGHNEGDDPSYTQPLMYKKIDARRSVRKLYTETLVKRGDITLEQAEQALDDFGHRLQAALDDTKERAEERGGDHQVSPPPPAVGARPPVDTTIDRATADRIVEALDDRPDSFTTHPKLAKQFERRRTMWAEDGVVDWALAEALALGSLLLEGTDVRIAGQDTRRGTFSHRHSVLVDYETGEEYAPLAHLSDDQGRWFIYDSLLSEYAAVGFEYGYSVENSSALVVWEAQFGDFVNGAQIVLDQFVVAAEDKWHQTSGLTMLLPHGYEGQGPEHSSARIERFLTLCAEDNIQVTYPSTAAQLFHLLRRQVHHTTAVAVVPLPHRGTDLGHLRGGRRRPRADRRAGHGRDQGGVGLGEGRLRGPRRARRDRIADSGDPDGAALPVARRPARRRAGAVPERDRAGLAAGGAREHGLLELRQGAALRGPRRGLRDPPRQSSRVRQPRDRQPRGPRTGAGRPGDPGHHAVATPPQPHRRLGLTGPDSPAPGLLQQQLLAPRGEIQPVLRTERGKETTVRNDLRLHELPSNQHGLVTVHQAHELGLTDQAIRHRLARGDWDRPRPRVIRSTSAPADDDQALMIAVLDGRALGHPRLRRARHPHQPPSGREQPAGSGLDDPRAALAARSPPHRLAGCPGHDPHPDRLRSRRSRLAGEGRAGAGHGLVPTTPHRPDPARDAPRAG
jgi:2-oxoglutarate dehydrogenase E1 component